MRLFWVPGYVGVVGNEAANKLARTASERSSRRDLLEKTCRADLGRDQKEIDKQWGRRFSSSMTGQFTRDLDKALPRRHMRKIYDRMCRDEAVHFIQLRTNHCRLNGHLAKIRASPTEICDCGQKETVKHFLIECPRWDAERQALKNAAGARWTDLSFLLGGWSDGKNPDGSFIDGPRDEWKPRWTVVKATIAFARSTRRLETDQGASQ